MKKSIDNRYGISVFSFTLLFATAVGVLLWLPLNLFIVSAQ